MSSFEEHCKSIPRENLWKTKVSYHLWKEKKTLFLVHDCVSPSTIFHVPLSNLFHCVYKCFLVLISGLFWILEVDFLISTLRIEKAGSHQFLAKLLAWEPIRGKLPCIHSWFSIMIPVSVVRISQLWSLQMETYPTGLSFSVCHQKGNNKQPWFS